MLAWVPEDEADRSVVHRITAERMRRNEEILLAARDHRGKPFEVIRVPIPIDIATSEFEVTEEVAERVLERTGIDLTENLGETHRRVSSAGYLNFVVTNGIFLVPDYLGEDTSEAQAGRDAKVQAIFAAAFPDREIIGIDPTELNWMGGGMHCVTVEVPRELNP
jgi:agmatine deiminase